MIIGSFDIIIGMDWVYANHVEVLCFDKALLLPLSNGKSVIIFGNKPSRSLRFISCMKAGKYLQKTYFAFSTHIVDMNDNKKKMIKEVPRVYEFPDVFPKDLPILPLVHQVEFRIDLVPGAAPVANSPYRLAPSEMHELSIQLQELLDKGFIRP